MDVRRARSRRLKHAASAAWNGTELRDDDVKNLAKSLSGFGNTGGGVLVYGARTLAGADGSDRLDALEPIERLASYLEKMRARIREATEPTMPGVQAEMFPDPAGSDRGVVAIHVPLSDGGPPTRP